MTKIKDGYQNEFDFVLSLNNKKVRELNPMLREMIDDLYPNIKEGSVIKSWKNHYSHEKTDIFIKIRNDTRRISIKKGSRNSVHVETIDTFKSFLKRMGIKKEIIKYYEYYHYGIDKDNEKNVMSASEYKEKYKEEIIQINEELKKINVVKLLNRFIFGVFYLNRVDGIIYGTPEDFFWLNKEDVINIIKNNMDRESGGIHFSCLFIQPLNRCLNNNPKYIMYRDYVQVKWYSLFDDIIEYKNNQISF